MPEFHSFISSCDSQVQKDSIQIQLSLPTTFSKSKSPFPVSLVSPPISQCQEQSKIQKEKPTTQPINKPKRSFKRPRRAPLYAIKSQGIDPFSIKSNQKTLLLNEMSSKDKHELYRELKINLENFLENATDNWNSNEQCRRFSIFGDIITCVRWEDSHYISTCDIVKLQKALYQLRIVDYNLRDIRLFEETIIGDLRTFRKNGIFILEKASSPLLCHMLTLNCIKTQKRQRVFLWNKFDHECMFEDAMKKERKRKSIGNPNFNNFANSPYNKNLDKIHDIRNKNDTITTIENNSSFGSKDKRRRIEMGFGNPDANANYSNSNLNSNSHHSSSIRNVMEWRPHDSDSWKTSSDSNSHNASPPNSSTMTTIIPVSPKLTSPTIKKSSHISWLYYHDEEYEINIDNPIESNHSNKQRIPKDRMKSRERVITKDLSTLLQAIEQVEADGNDQ